ncbi:hypothetical protein MIND_00703900 [Mycena indigotica]|uniref:Uncharacterized protein n=1 Tax=Mycena indigotica TaxID=2126181 RepID=A0A8H6SM72_9AGAR|nr:uncharacterized protein MIND_00703900 [Mycena indigotica]KAF7301387.1 hypothetical protein MIND_00703900 [Mycena indigotica]
MALIGGILSGLFDPPPPKTPPPPGPIFSLPGITFPTLSLPGLPTGPPTIPSPSSSLPLSSSLPVSSSAPVSESSAAPPPSSTLPPETTPSPQSLPPPATSTSLVIVGNAPAQSGSVETPPLHQKTFLQNKPLSGTVFGLVGLVALVLIIVVATFFLRRRRRSRLLDDALTFDPSLLGKTDRVDSSEKGHSNNPSLGTTNHGGYSTYAASQHQQPHSDYYGRGGQQVDYYGQAQHADYYGQQPQADYYGGARQPNYGYVPPMADVGNSWGQQQPASSQQQQQAVAPPPPQQQTNIPRATVPPQPAPLPAEFGSSNDDARRRSAEETAFWARTLKVVNE